MFLGEHSQRPGDRTADHVSAPTAGGSGAGPAASPVAGEAAGRCGLVAGGVEPAGRLAGGQAGTGAAVCSAAGTVRGAIRSRSRPCGQRDQPDPGHVGAGDRPRSASRLCPRAQCRLAARCRRLLSPGGTAGTATDRRVRAQPRLAPRRQGVRMNIVWAIAAVVLVAGAALTAYRILVGPSTLDRLVALDTLVALAMCGLGAWAAFSLDSTVLYGITALSLITFVGSVSVARFRVPDVERGDERR